MLLAIHFVLLSWCCFAANGENDALPQESEFGAFLIDKSKSRPQDAVKHDSSSAKNAQNVEVQRRNLRLYPEWFSQRIKKIAAKGFAHTIPFAQDKKGTAKDTVPTPKFRRSSLYGLGSHNPVIVSDDADEGNFAQQSLPAGSELVDLPNNFQELSPNAFHDISHAYGR